MEQQKNQKPKTKKQLLFDEGKSYCPTCKQIKVLEEFYTDKQAPRGKCIYCRECMRLKNNSRYTKLSKQEKYKRHLIAKFHISPELYESILVEQNERCAICNTKFDDQITPCIDHNHSTGNIRGILCTRCNLGLGNFRDNIEYLESAKQYIQNRLKENNV